jgi:hypothetical protein
MPEPCDDPNQRVRDILERPVAELVELGLEGGATAAQSMIAFQMIIRLQLADAREELERLRDEIDDYLEAEDDEPPVPLLRVVQ